MDLFDVLLQVGLVTTALVGYLLIFRRSSPIQIKGNYRQPAWNYFFRLVSARFAVRRWKSRRKATNISETPRVGQLVGWDGATIRASAPDGSTLLLSIRKLYDKKIALAEVTVFIKLPDGTCYKLKLPQHPQTVVGPWEDIESGWSAGGLKIEVLEEQMRLRILYNGLLTRDGDDVTQHVICNFIWTAASPVVRYPEDWSDELAAQALALEPWRDGDWPNLLGKYGDGSWLQFGTVQGRFESYNEEGATDKSVYLRVRGIKERSWSLTGYGYQLGPIRAVSIVAAAKDGTAVQMQGFCYRDVLTVGYSGSVRFPDNSVESITGTDLILEQFCESRGEVPSVYSINVSTKKRDLKLILRISSDGDILRRGVPYYHLVYYRTMFVDIDGEVGTGVLQLDYQTTVPSTISLPRISLRWAKECDVGSVEYCVPFEAAAAACPSYVGGKGASLALMASVQQEMGYKVPPGYCLTTKALEKHLKTNPQLKSAILDIEAANEDYDENNFKEKCNKATELFAKTDITGEVREQILLHLNELRQKAIEQNLGPELRFAVRSSAVGEDSEALSAAGQNETILGCVSETDVLRGVQLCWGSMFAFTSAHYRRVHGQACSCGGAVVVQALVRARAAGVLFTRHPARGDRSRLLITANYGLGESVVSGLVEPDTIIVSRAKELSISKIELGSKKQRVTPVGSSVVTEEVAEREQKLPCLTVSEALALARIGVAQEEAWGAGRDIEWAITKDGIYLLQARPITSLERWTEEELLHEMDGAVMSDDDLLTFANTGEVMPKPVTALSYDLVYHPLTEGIDTLIKGVNKFDRNVVFTHHRCMLALYNSMYRVVPKEIDLATRMMEISIFGHKLMDQRILSVAHHRRPFSRFMKYKMTLESFWYLAVSNWSMKNAIKAVNSINIDASEKDPLVLLESIASMEPVLSRCSSDHACTSGASTCSQLVAIMVLTEGSNDFTSEHCNEMNVLLSSGGVLSAEVPQALAKIARLLEDSGKGEQFRAQDPKEALEWLKANVPVVHREVTQFLEEHGHRAIMEFDLYTKPWALVPEQMMEVLQNVRATEEQKPAARTDDEIIASLKTPQKPNTRKVLRWVLPLCRRTVRHRENTKAHLILAVHKLRVAALSLGRLLVRTWHLPDPDLVFHFRLHELRTYMRNRDPALLKKAIQRRQYHPSWCKLKFAETHFGWVQPLAAAPPRVTAGAVRVRATAVCGGEVVARACVVKDLSEIGQLQRGDVLITHSTDIGWSPYFPLLAGIVTELGGLISHGAVIAREYGLPCLVGAAQATDLFATGDTVRLDASQGLIEAVRVHDASVNTPPDSRDAEQGLIEAETVHDASVNTPPVSRDAQQGLIEAVRVHEASVNTPPDSRDAQQGVIEAERVHGASVNTPPDSRDAEQGLIEAVRVHDASVNTPPDSRDAEPGLIEAVRVHDASVNTPPDSRNAQQGLIEAERLHDAPTTPPASEAQS